MLLAPVTRINRQDFLWELRGCINLPCCLYSFHKSPSVIFSWRLGGTTFPPRVPAEAGNRHTSSRSLPPSVLSLLLPQRGLWRAGNICVRNLVPSACSAACLHYPTLSKHHEVLRVRCIYLHWPRAACVLLTLPERSQGKVCLNLAVR